ncbi:hypothetical protein ACJJTC_010600 [Scirpophaga incertulas]
MLETSVMSVTSYSVRRKRTRETSTCREDLSDDRSTEDVPLTLDKAPDRKSKRRRSRTPKSRIWSLGKCVRFHVSLPLEGSGDEPMQIITERIARTVDIVLLVAERSSNLKGTFVKALKNAVTPAGDMPSEDFITACFGAVTIKRSPPIQVPKRRKSQSPFGSMTLPQPFQNTKPSETSY